MTENNLNDSLPPSNQPPKLKPISLAILFISLALITISATLFPSLLHQARIAEIASLPATPPVSPPLPPSTAISWQTPSVSLQADKLEISTNTQGSGYADKLFLGNTNTISNFTLHSDPATNHGNYTTLEATWNENNVEMRLFLYFEAYTETNGGSYATEQEAYAQGFTRKWRVTEIRTYNGNSPGDWVTSYSGGAALFTPTNIGSQLYIPDLELSTSGGGIFHVKFTNLRLQAFLEESTCTRQTPSVTLTPNSQQAYPGQTLTYNAVVTNNDSAACGNSTFGLGTMTEYGFTFEASHYDNVVIGPGQNDELIVTAKTPTTNTWGETKTVNASLSAHNNNSGIYGVANAKIILLMPEPQTFDFTFKIDGVTDGSADGTKASIKLYLKDGNVMTFSEPITLHHSTENYYKARVTVANPLAPGTQFRIKVKGEKHIALLYCKASGQTQPCGDNDYLTIPTSGVSNLPLYFADLPLPPGDLPPQDGKAGLSDLTQLKTLMGKAQSTLTADDLYSGDLNYDNRLNVFDVFLILKTMEARYDE